MTALWSLPQSLSIAGKEYGICADFRDVLEIFSYFQEESLPPFLRWEIALGLFYKEEIPQAHKEEAMEKLSLFLSGGQEQAPGPKLLDWDHDASVIVADVNKVAGTEIRALPFVHWWTFLSWFNALGEGQLSTIVSIRSKLAHGKKLDDGEKEFYRHHKDRVDLPKRYTAREQAERARLLSLLESEKAGD